MILEDIGVAVSAGDIGLVYPFMQAARVLGSRAVELGLVAPAFRAPPRDGANRTVRFYPDGVVVAVRLAGRQWADVLTDMVVGVLVANHLDATDSRAGDLLRAALG